MKKMTRGGQQKTTIEVFIPFSGGPAMVKMRFPPEPGGTVSIPISNANMRLLADAGKAYKSRIGGEEGRRRQAHEPVRQQLQALILRCYQDRCGRAARVADKWKLRGVYDDVIEQMKASPQLRHLLDDVEVGGLTPAAIRARIRRALSPTRKK